MSQVSLVTVTKLSPKGEGIAYDDGREIYLENVLLGEQLEVEVASPFVQGSKRYPGKVLRIVKPSADRCSTIECQYFGKCGGCALQHMNYAAQLKQKRSDIKAAMKDVVTSFKRPDLLSEEMLDDLIKDTVPCTERPCRFKSIRYFANQANTNELNMGFYASRTHDLVPIDSCPLEPESFATIASSLLSTLRTLKLYAANQDCIEHDSADGNDSTHILKALQLRQCDDGVAVLLITTAALTQEQISALKDTSESLSLASFYVGINTQEGNSLYCEDVALISGAPRLSKTIANKDFYVGPQTFLQVNYGICEQLYGAAVAHCASVNQSIGASTLAHDSLAASCAASGSTKYASTTGDTAPAPATVCAVTSHVALARGKAIDLCCGVGTMTLALSEHFEHVTGVEIVQSSIDAAKENADCNGITNVSFIASDISKALPKLLSKKMLGEIMAVIVDPSRAGIGAANAALLSKIKGPCKISMIFCSLKALKRDLAPLLLGGFKIDYVQGFDMFPSSVHIETLVCLTKNP